MKRAGKEFSKAILGISFLMVAALVGVSSASSDQGAPKGSIDFMKKAWGFQGGYGVEVAKALKLMKKDCSNSGIVVAVIDTGVDINHFALKNSIWTNEKEANGKVGVDNDGDGFVGDVHGWDFVKSSGVISDSHGHGTHIAGIIGAKSTTSDEFSGVCPGVKIMPLRYYDPNGTGEANLKNTIRAIQFAVDHKVDIINYSGGGAEFAREEFKALSKAEDLGILVVAAAGNERSDADKNLYFPSAYPLSNIISVTAINDGGQILPSSNWGTQKVHVAAPGQAILSTQPNGGFGFMTGTSQATAFVTGIAALLLTEHPELHSLKPAARIAKLKAWILNSSYKQPSLVGKTQTAARANAYAALELSNQKEKRTISSTKTKKVLN